MRRLVWIGGAIGTAVGATVLAAAAVVFRRPENRIGGDLHAATTYLAVSLAGGLAVAVFIVFLATLMLRGRPVAVATAALLAGVTVAAAFAFLGKPARAAAWVISGPGAHPVVTMSRITWVLFAVASLVLLAVAVFVEPGAAIGRSGTRTAAVVGLVTAIALGTAGVAMATVSRTAIEPTASIAIPATPTMVGEREAYRLRSEIPQYVVPAGPGFVTVDSAAVTAYDGTTGVGRWRLPTDRLPDGCYPDGTWSTGTDATSVVIVHCARDDADGDQRDEKPSFTGLSGFDAMTGRHLWTNADGWGVHARSVSDGEGAVGVSRGDGDDAQIGALDVRSGHLRWSRPVTDCADLFNATTATHSLVVFEACSGGKDVLAVLYDLESGSSRRIPIPLPQWRNVDAKIMLDVFSVAGSNVTVLATLDRTWPEVPLATIDTSSATARVEWGQVDWLDLDPENGLIQGDVAQTQAFPGDGTTEVLMTASGERRRLSGLDIYTSWSSAALNSWRFALVGDRVVTATEFGDGSPYWLVTVNPDGSSSRRPSPCGRAPGGVAAVPGAVLLICPLSADEKERPGTEIIALQ